MIQLNMNCRMFSLICSKKFHCCKLNNYSLRDVSCMTQEDKISSFHQRTYSLEDIWSKHSIRQCLYTFPMSKASILQKYCHISNKDNCKVRRINLYRPSITGRLSKISSKNYSILLACTGSSTQYNFLFFLAEIQEFLWNTEWNAFKSHFWVT